MVQHYCKKEDKYDASTKYHDKEVEITEIIFYAFLKKISWKQSFYKIRYQGRSTRGAAFEEKCTKMLSRLKIFREITQQKFAKSAFANARFSTL